MCGDVRRRSMAVRLRRAIIAINRNDISIDRFFVVVGVRRILCVWGFPRSPRSSLGTHSTCRYAFTEVLSGKEMYKQGLRAYPRRATGITTASAAYLNEVH